MAYKINDQEFHSVIQVPEGTRYEVDELYRYVAFGGEMIQAAIRVREEGRKTVTMGLLRQVESPIVFLETRSDKWRGSGSLPENKGYGNVREIVDHDVRRHYAQQVFGLPNGSLDEMVESFEWQIIEDAFSRFGGNQSVTAKSLRLPRSVFQGYLNRLQNKGHSVGKDKKITIELGSYQSMVNQCETILLTSAFQQAEKNHTEAARLLKVPRTTFSDRLKRLGISA